MTTADPQNHQRRILVTGATDGIGKQTALELARRGHPVVVHGRSAEKVGAAVRELQEQVSGGSFAAATADLSSLAQTRALGERLLAEGKPFYALINNAGVFMNDRVLTAEGHETTVAVNHLAPFVLTLTLLPLLGTQGESRVVNVSSIAHSRGKVPTGNMTFENSFDGYGAYAASKLMNVLFTVELAKRGLARNVSSHALHPGVITTKLLATGFNSTGASLAKGAETSVFAATSPSLNGKTGLYLSDSRIATPSERAQDAAAARALWQWTEAATGLAWPA